MMARMTSVGSEAFSRSDRISNGLSTAMRDHRSGNPSRVDMLLGLASPQSQSPLLDANELNEEDVWGAATDVRASPEDNIPVADMRKFETGNFGSADKDVVVEVAADPVRFVSNGRRWLGRESGLSVAYADTGRSRPFPSPLNRAAVNANGTFSSRDGFNGRTASRLMPTREAKVISHFSKMSSGVEANNMLPQSAPVNFPDWSKTLGNERKPQKFVDDYVVPENDEDEERLPPHVLIAREYARNQTTTFSMCDGSGGTLKGRHLSRVRHAVLRQTGFLNDQ